MRKIGLMIIIVMMTLSSCIKTKMIYLPSCNFSVQNEHITGVDTSAVVRCDFTIKNVNSLLNYTNVVSEEGVFFVYGESDNNMQNVLMEVVNTTEYHDGFDAVTSLTLRVALSGLRPNTTYNYYYVCRNGFDSIWTETKSFKIEPALTLPTVITGDITGITTNSAHVQWFVTDDGGNEVVASGYCWSVNENPSLDGGGFDGMHVMYGVVVGEYYSILGGLNPNTTYHVRAYATNAVGTAYGEDKTFTTLSADGSNAPIGAIDDLFTINANGMDGRAIQDN